MPLHRLSTRLIPAHYGRTEQLREFGSHLIYLLLKAGRIDQLPLNVEHIPRTRQRWRFAGERQPPEPLIHQCRIPPGCRVHLSRHRH